MGGGREAAVLGIRTWASLLAISDTSYSQTMTMLLATSAHATHGVHYNCDDLLNLVHETCESYSFQCFHLVIWKSQLKLQLQELGEWHQAYTKRWSILLSVVNSRSRSRFVVDDEVVEVVWVAQEIHPVPLHVVNSRSRSRYVVDDEVVEVVLVAQEIHPVPLHVSTNSVGASCALCHEMLTNISQGKNPDNHCYPLWPLQVEHGWSLFILVWVLFRLGSVLLILVGAWANFFLLTAWLESTPARHTFYLNHCRCSLDLHLEHIRASTVCGAGMYHHLITPAWLETHQGYTLLSWQAILCYIGQCVL